MTSQPKDVDLKRLFDAASTSDYYKRPAATGTADYVVHNAGRRLLDYARWMDENLDLVVGALDLLVTGIIGAGIQISPQVKTRRGAPLPKVNAAITKALKPFYKDPLTNHEANFAEMQRLMCRAWFRDGEIFPVHNEGPTNANRRRRIPYSVRMMETDWLPMEYPIGDRNKNIIHGIEKDADGAPVTYYFLKELGDPRYLTMGLSVSETIPTPATRVEHLKLARRFGQTRGVTLLAPVIRRLESIKDGEESELIAMRVAASFTAAVIQSPDAITMPTNDHESETGDVTGQFRDRYLEMAPGAVWDLSPGEDVKGIGLDRPNNNLIDFLNEQHRRVASAMTVPASGLMKKYDGSYSAMRQEAAEHRPQYDRLRNQFIDQGLAPIYERALFWAIESAAVTIPPQADPETIFDADYRAPAIPHIDPLAELQAEALAVEKGFKSRQMVIREHGNDPTIVNEQLEEDSFVPHDQRQQPASAENQPEEQDNDEQNQSD